MTTFIGCRRSLKKFTKKYPDRLLVGNIEQSIDVPFSRIGADHWEMSTAVDCHCLWKSRRITNWPRLDGIWSTHSSFFCTRTRRLPGNTVDISLPSQYYTGMYSFIAWAVSASNQLNQGVSWGLPHRAGEGG